MPGARLEVVLEPLAEGFGPNGREAVELRVATESGDRSRRRFATRPRAASSRG